MFLTTNLLLCLLRYREQIQRVVYLKTPKTQSFLFKSRLKIIPKQTSIDVQKNSLFMVRPVPLVFETCIFKDQLQTSSCCHRIPLLACFVVSVGSHFFMHYILPCHLLVINFLVLSVVCSHFHAHACSPSCSLHMYWTVLDMRYQNARFTHAWATAFHDVMVSNMETFIMRYFRISLCTVERRHTLSVLIDVNAGGLCVFDWLQQQRRR